MTEIALSLTKLNVLYNDIANRRFLFRVLLRAILLHDYLDNEEDNKHVLLS